MFDPQYGSGSMLIAAKKYLNDMGNGSILLNGFENNERLWISAWILSILTDTNMELVEEDFLQSLADNGVEKKYDMVLTVPPFSNENVRNPRRIPNLPFIVRGRYNLFLIKTIQAMKEQGTAAIIVPDNFLFATRNESVEVRKWILENYQLEAVISLPPKTFRPASAVNASVLLISGDAGNRERSMPYVLFYQLSDKTEEEEQFDNLEKVWEQKDDLFKQWMSDSENSLENHNNVLTPEDWKPEEFWFADFQAMESSNWNLLPGYYRPAALQELKFEDPKKLMDIRH